MIRHVVMWELHDPAQAPAFRAALLPCARLVAGTRGYEVAIKSDTLPASVHVCLIATFDDAACAAALSGSSDAPGGGAAHRAAAQAPAHPRLRGGRRAAAPRRRPSSASWCCDPQTLPRRALAAQRIGEQRLAIARSGLDQREVDQVALRVAAAEAVRLAAQRPQQPHRLAVVGRRRRRGSRAWRRSRPRAGTARCRRRSPAPRAPALASSRCGVVAAAGADEGHHRVQVVERVVAGVGHRRPALGQRLPARADVDAAQLQPPQQRRGVDHVEHQRRLAAEDRAVDQRAAPRRCRPRPRWNSARCHQLCTAKKLPSLQRRRVARRARRRHRGGDPASPSRGPPRARPSRRAVRARPRAGPAPRRARSRRFPPGRTRACRAPRDSRACRAATRGSARAMRSRSMRESPVKKSIWWPACSASASSG